VLYRSIRPIPNLALRPSARLRLSRHLALRWPFSRHPLPVRCSLASLKPLTEALRTRRCGTRKAICEHPNPTRCLRASVRYPTRASHTGVYLIGFRSKQIVSQRH
jgi:hypothetical protein